MSYQKKDGRGHARPSCFWYDNDKDLKVCFFVTRVIYCGVPSQGISTFFLDNYLRDLSYWTILVTVIHRLQAQYIIQCSQKVSFHSETGPGFPQNDQNPKRFCKFYFYWSSDTKKLWILIILGKCWACFGTESYSFCPL